MAAKAEAFDILVLGAGPAGISAARSLQKEGSKSFVVLEARSRVGGRVFASDSLGVNRDLDHGARWIHGACSDNSMVKLLRDMVFDHPDDEGIEYEVCLPQEPSNSNDNECGNNGTTPPFELSEVDHSELIVKIKNNLQEQQSPPPSKNLTLILKERKDGDIAAQKPSSNAQAVARRIFQDVVESAMDYPRKKLNSSPIADSIEESAFLEASLLDLLLWAYDSPNQQLTTMNDTGKRERFESLCRGQLVMEHPFLQEAKELMKSKEERQAFRHEVMALFNLEIATVLESWEGSSLHVISAKNGMKGTCLEGGNKIMPFGYGGLIRRLAYPLIQGKHIRLQHEVLSITTTTNSDDSSSKVIVRCKVPNGSIQEFHAKAVIVALPLGVLRAAIASPENESTDNSCSDNRIVFEPQLPSPLVHAIQSLGITVREKIELAFSHCFWPADMGRFTLACTHLQQSPTYHPYTTFIVESASSSSFGPNILVCYVAGEFAKEMEQKSDETIQKEVMRVLREANIHHSADDGNNYAVDIPDPIAMHVTRWLNDPYSRGSWTHYGKGSSPADVQSFRSNEECRKRRLFFAGEHTCDGSQVKGDDQGCVHGAWVSGELAVEAALKCIS